MSTVQSKPVKLNPYSEIKIGTQVYWYSQGNKNLDPLPAIVIGKIPQTGAADLSQETQSILSAQSGWIMSTFVAMAAGVLKKTNERRKSIHRRVLVSTCSRLGTADSGCAPRTSSVR